MSTESDSRPMINADNNDTELGLALGYSVPPIQTRSNNKNNNLGAGVNAGSSLNIAFVASNPLSELVWSPSNGLSLKCADKKSAFLWDVGPSNAVPPPADSVSSKGTNDENTIAKGKSIQENNADTEAAKDAGFESALSTRKFGGLFGSSHEGQTQNDGSSVEANTAHDQEQECQGKNEEESLCGPKNMQLNILAETSDANAGEVNRRTTDFLLLVNNESKSDRMSGSSGKIEVIASGSQPLGLEIAMASQNQPVEELALATEENEIQTNAHGHTSDPLLEKMESSAENDLQNSNERESKDDNDSHESMESCSSAALFTKGKKRWGFEPAMILGSKKMKRQIQESSSASVVRPDSSFMNWISNMVKGLPKSNQDPGPGLDCPSHRLDSDDNRIVTWNKTHDSGSRTMGFQTIFQSLYCPNTKVQETRESNEDYPAGSCKELEWNEKTGPDATQVSLSVEDDNSCKHFLDKNKNLVRFTTKIGGPSTQPWFFQLKEKNESAENILESESSDGKGIQSKGYVNDPSGSLWITRFSTKTPIFPVVQKSSEGKELQNEGPSTESSVGFKRVRGNEYQDSTFRLNPSAGSQALRSSGAMASVFAKRLDALKHIISSDIKNDETHSKKITCFFCGQSGHGLRDCSEVKEAELKDLLGRISSYDGTEQHSCLCIRCFQVDHWAITCPLASSSWQQQCEHSSDRCTSTSKMNENGQICEDVICGERKPRTGTNVKMVSEQRGSRSGEDEEKNRISPLCNFDRKEIKDVPKGMFEMIRKLRFSRGDILKWMNSHNSLSDMDGFFVRLRLGKWEGGLGGTGYYVACITGVERDKSSKHSKNPIGVCVGGIKCLVESQYVSNHDFLEDELMAWWNITSRNRKIPSEAELKWKFELRKKLGF